MDRFEIADQIQGSKRFMYITANSFYIIACLSLFSTIFYFSETPFYFIYFLFGLGATQLIDSLTLNVLVPEIGRVGYVIGIAINIAIIAIFILLGYYGGSKKIWPFAVGSVLYALDAIIFIAVEDFVSVFFHALLLLIIPWGIRAVKKLREAEKLLADLDNNKAE